jgi:WD40 repeat protein
MYPTSHIERRYSVVTGSDDRKVKVVAIETGQVIFDTAFHDDWVRSVVFGSEFFFSGSDDRQVTHSLIPPFSLCARSMMVIGL